MTDLDHRIEGAESRAREEVLEKHFFREAQPFFPLGFSVGWRNPGHWDIYATQTPGKVKAWLQANPGGKTSAHPEARTDERAFRIRGEPGAVTVLDERWDPTRPRPRPHQTFRSVTVAMLWIVEELMQEPPEA